MRLHPANVFFTSLLMATTMVSMITPLTADTAIMESIDEPKMELTASQADWLAKLEEQESSGSTTIRILDTNHKFSTGCLQFQDETFLTQGKKYGLITTSTDQAEPLIYNCELQYKIAHKMLMSDGGWKHWKNSVLNRNLGPYPKN